MPTKEDFLNKIKNEQVKTELKEVKFPKRSPDLFQKEIHDSKTRLKNKSDFPAINTPDLASQVKTLCGIMKKTFEFFVAECLENNSLKTGIITPEALVTISGTSKSSIRNVIKRLTDRGLVNVLEVKKGRGGYSIYGIPQDALNIYLKNQKKYYSKHEFKDDLFARQTDIIQNTSDFSVTEQLGISYRSKLPGSWKSINILPLEEQALNWHHIYDIYMSQASDPMIVNESIKHLAYTIEYKTSVKPIETPIKLLVNLLKKGKVYTDEKYKNVKDLLIEKIIEEKEERQKKRKEKYKKIFSLSFEEWFDEINESEIINFLTVVEGNDSITADLFKKSKDRYNTSVENTLKRYFKGHIWDIKKKELNIAPML